MKKIVIVVVAAVTCFLIGSLQSWGQDWSVKCGLRCEFLGYKVNEQTCECEKIYGLCPLCGSKGECFDWKMWNGKATLSIELYICPKCHLLFWENSKKEGEKE